MEGNYGWQQLIEYFKTASREEGPRGFQQKELVFKVMDMLTQTAHIANLYPNSILYSIMCKLKIKICVLNKKKEKKTKGKYFHLCEL